MKRGGRVVLLFKKKVRGRGDIIDEKERVGTFKIKTRRGA